MKKFEIIKDYFNEGENIFNKETITINPGVTVLVGCNGIGKSTLLEIIEDRLKKDNIKYIKYDNMINGGNYAMESALGDQNFDLLSRLVTGSEGENIMINIENFATELGNFTNEHVEEKEIWILLDSIDSGLSIDNIIIIKDFFDLIINIEKNKDIYIVVSANTYELVKDRTCFDVYNGKYITFENYEEYRNFILKSKAIKNERFKTTE